MNAYGSEKITYHGYGQGNSYLNENGFGGYYEQKLRDLKKDVLKASVKPAEEHFKTVCEKFKESLKDYREATKDGWYALWFGMDQEIGTNTNKITKNAILNNGTTVVSQCKENKITLYHGFQSAGKPIPIPDTKFKIYAIKKEDGFWAKFLSSMVWMEAAEAGQNISNNEMLQFYSPIDGILNFGKEIVLGDKVKNTLQPSGSSQNQLDKNGMAELEGLEKGKLYAIQFSPNVTQADFDRLFASYQSFIDQILALLDSSWETIDEDDDMNPKRKQREIYQDYYEQVQAETYKVDGGKVMSAVLSGIWYALLELWDGLETIILWATNPKSYVKVAKYLSNPEQMEKDIDAIGANLDKFISILKDEALLFLIFKAISAYIELLTPEQATLFIAEGLAPALIQTIISLLIPGRTIAHAIDLASIVGGETELMAQKRAQLVQHYVDYGAQRE